MREYWVDPLTLVRVSEVMAPPPPSVPATMTVGELFDRIEHEDPELTRRRAVLIVDQRQRMVGIVTRGDLAQAVAHSRAAASVGDVGSRDPAVTYPDELVLTALDKMLLKEIGRLPVVSREDPTRVVGYLGRAEVLAARRRRFAEEQMRERGWLTNATRLFRRERIRRTRRRPPSASLPRKTTERTEK